jgi:hypothetical protein
VLIESRGEKEEMLSRDCDGCSQFKVCSKRFSKALRGDKVYCPDGTVHLVDEASELVADLYLVNLEAFQ